MFVPVALHCDAELHDDWQSSAIHNCPAFTCPENAPLRQRRVGQVPTSYVASVGGSRLESNVTAFTREIADVSEREMRSLVEASSLDMAMCISIVSFAPVLQSFLNSSESTVTVSLVSVCAVPDPCWMYSLLFCAYMEVGL